MTPRALLRVLVSPALLCALAFLAALAAVMQYSVRAYVPGSLDVGGFTLDIDNMLVGRTIGFTS